MFANKFLISHKNLYWVELYDDDDDINCHKRKFDEKRLCKALKEEKKITQ